MAGGIDAEYMMQFGPEIQMRVRRQIYDRHAGALLVGVVEIVETGHPTDSVSDRGPDDAGADGASRLNQCLPCSPRCVPPCPARHLHKRTTRWSAILRTMSRPSHCRGLAQASARIGFNTCARQVRAAIDDVLLEKYEMPHSWAEASERHQLLYTDRPTRLQY